MCLIAVIVCRALGSIAPGWKRSGLMAVPLPTGSFRRIVLTAMPGLGKTEHDNSVTQRNHFGERNEKT